MPRFTRNFVASWIACATAVFSATPMALGTEPDNLQSVLKEESNGNAVTRLLPAGGLPADDVSAWQAGMIRIDNKWMNVEQIANSENHPEYQAMRAELQNKPQKHLLLARWCVLHQLPDLARAHYFGVLAVDGNNLEARKYVRHVFTGDTWVGQADLQIAQQTMHQMLQKLEDWTPKVKGIVQNLHSGRTKVMTEALNDLDQLDTSAALPALELFASNVDDDLAKPLIRKIASERSAEACAALIRIALAHPSADVQALTADAIRKYPESYYVPDLLSMLSSEIQVENQLVMQPNGNISLITLFRSELQNRKQLQRAQKLVNVVSTFSSHHSAKIFDSTTADMSYWSEYWKVSKSAPVNLGSVSTSRSMLNAGSASTGFTYVPQDVARSVAENLDEQRKQQVSAAARQNRELSTKVNRICTLLRATTIADIEDKPELWWSWWNDRSERYQGSKPTAFAYTEQREQIAISTQAYSRKSSERVHDLGQMLVQYSCLVPGSLVQTATGLVPIEKIQIGDMVVSQNVETAELTLKPVILTTIRPPKSTIKITAGNNTMEATGGHLWWVSGLGWMKSRDLKAGMMLHTATGTTEVADVVANPTAQQTHNLVVDGFHTYFVGPNRVLSYDNTLVKPTLRQVPGYGQIADVAR